MFQMYTACIPDSKKVPKFDRRKIILCPLRQFILHTKWNVMKQEEIFEYVLIFYVCHENIEVDQFCIVYLKYQL